MAKVINNLKQVTTGEVTVILSIEEAEVLRCLLGEYTAGDAEQIVETYHDSRFLIPVRMNQVVEKVLGLYHSLSDTLESFDPEEE